MQDTATGLEARICPTQIQAWTRCIEIMRAGGSPILQSKIPGMLIAIVVVADQRARLRAIVQQEAERIWPPEAGTSARARTVPLDKDLVGSVATLVAELGWTGLAQLQFIRGPDGRARLTDFNGRFYGSMALALGAGVNLPAIWASMATDGHTGSPVEARPGVRFHWLEGDLRRAFDERRGGLFNDVATSIRYGRGACASIWSLEDAWPGIWHVGSLLARGTNKLAGGSRRDRGGVSGRQ